MQIGPYTLRNSLILAPMAGVTDLPYRELCRRLGAGMAVSEMVASNPALWDTQKSRLRIVHGNEPEPRSVQIAGSDPSMLADCARYNVEQGAQIIDINMGCPAKKVCRKEAGSALLADERLVERILTATVGAVGVPVTLKIRTGISPERRNGVRIAKIAEACGISALAVHGRTRADAYRGQAEYETIRAIKQAVRIPVLANGDIDSAEKAAEVLRITGADGLLIGRAAQGRPWIFREIDHFLRTGERLREPDIEEVATIMLGHIAHLHRFYGEYQGLRVARKHIGWYLNTQPNGAEVRRRVVRVDSAEEQLGLLREYFGRQINAYSESSDVASRTTALATY
ncbi:tRNA dihydrouridine synthase DusB [Alkalilimnicola ehrlichii]|uniref:tRNA dihydrouridine synthase DusB n=1 Tax=Alkalilimnicola ehrlichii TaxID=351052 RepID=UPI000E2EBC71|nr:tRNA dihydrouridine synthase DusB [Alkalilimnicola ehrlichii]RFA28981.1 tRNA dihydrouridine synthase DusB [Alkalilimnicola ehrlichii]